MSAVNTINQHEIQSTNDNSRHLQTNVKFTWSFNTKARTNFIVNLKIAPELIIEYLYIGDSLWNWFFWIQVWKRTHRSIEGKNTENIFLAACFRTRQQIIRDTNYNVKQWKHHEEWHGQELKRERGRGRGGGGGKELPAHLLHMYLSWMVGAVQLHAPCPMCMVHH